MALEINVLLCELGNTDQAIGTKTYFTCLTTMAAFSVTVIKNFDKGNLLEEVFILAHSSRYNHQSWWGIRVMGTGSVCWLVLCQLDIS